MLISRRSVKCRFAVIVAAFFIAPATAVATEDALVRSIVITDAADHVLGRGMSLLTLAPRADCIEPKAAEPALDKFTVEFDVRELFSSYELQTFLDISASAEVSWAIGASASSSLDYVNSVKFYRSSYYFGVKVGLKGQGETIRGARLKREFAALLVEGGDIGKFVALCGEGYLASRSTGADLYTIVEVQTKNEEDKREVRGKLGFSAPIGTTGGSASASGSITQKLVELTQSRASRIWSVRHGGDALKLVTTADDLKAALSDVEHALGKNQTTTKTVVFSYLLTDNGPSIALETFLAVMEPIEKYRKIIDYLRDRIAQIEEVIDNPGGFLKPSLSDLHDELTTSTRTLKDVIESARICVLHQAPCTTPELHLGQLVLPERLG